MGIAILARLFFRGRGVVVVYGQAAQTLLERIAQVGRPIVLFQQVAEGHVGEPFQRDLGVGGEQRQCAEQLIVEIKVFPHRTSLKIGAEFAASTILPVVTRER